MSDMWTDPAEETVSVQSPAGEAETVRISAPELELIVQVLNINAGCNEDLKSQCQTLGEYMQYVDKVRSYAGSLPISEAVDRALDECIDQYDPAVLRQWLKVAAGAESIASFTRQAGL